MVDWIVCVCVCGTSCRCGVDARMNAAQMKCPRIYSRLANYWPIYLALLCSALLQLRQLLWFLALNLKLAADFTAFTLALTLADRESYNIHLRFARSSSSANANVCEYVILALERPLRSGASLAFFAHKN